MMNLPHFSYSLLLAGCLIGGSICSASESKAPPRKGPKVAVPGGKHHIANSFRINLNIKNGHIGSVEFGCRDGATDGYDRRIDDMAPPPGIGGVGYTFLVSPDRKFNLYKDIRAYADTVQWVFYAKIGRKPVVLSWEKSQIPNAFDLYCAEWDGRSEAVADTVNCRELESVTAEKTTFFRFWIVKRQADAEPDSAPEVLDDSAEKAAIDDPADEAQIGTDPPAVDTPVE